MTSLQIPIFCGGCGHEEVVAKVASTMSCRKCGSTDLGLTGVDQPTKTGGLTAEAVQRLAAPRGYGTGWGKPHPDPLKGWESEYAGPTPQTFPRSAPVADSTTCPTCHGSRYDLIDKGPCRECGGTGVITHPTDRPATLDYDATTQNVPAGGAGWRGASFQGLTRDRAADLHQAFGEGLTAQAQQRLAARPNIKDPYGPVHQLQRSAPNYGHKEPSAPFNPSDAQTFYRKAPERSPHVRDWQPAKPANGPYQMNEATCPACGHSPTELRKDRNQDAWWVCPQCGPLANIDRHIGKGDLEVDPYQPPRGFTPDREMKTGGFLARKRKTGRLFTVLATIHASNDLGEREALELARKTIRHYGEDR